MTKIYCTKCRKKTDSTNEQVVDTKNNRKRIAAKCKICKGGKSMFLGNTSNVRRDKKKEPKQEKKTIKCCPKCLQRYKRYVEELKNRD